MENRESEQRHHNKFAAVCIAILVLALFAAALSNQYWENLNIRDLKGTVFYEENPWNLENQDILVESDIQLPAFRKLKTGQLYTLSTRLTYDGRADAMPYGFVHLDHAYCRVLLDEKVLFSCMPEDMPKKDASKSPGFIYKAFPVPEDCQGRQLKIEILPMLNESIEYGLPEISFGNYSSVIYAAVARDTPHNIIVAVTAFIGIVSILFSTFALCGNDYREGISIGIFSLLFSLYLIVECRLNYYYIGNPYYLYVVNYVAFSLLPVALMGFMRERLLEKHRKICTGFIVGEIIFFLAEIYFHFSGTFDMREIVPLIHFIYFLDVALVFILMQQMKDKRKKHIFIAQLTPIVVGMCLDAAIYWFHWKVGSNDANFTIFGVVIFLIIEIVHVWRTSVSIYTESVRSSLYRQMAYVDELTGAANRRSYDDEIDKIISGAISYDSMIVVSADVNKLKYVNDHFGHAAGDQLIHTAAQIMMEITGDRGTVFRTGGDEFSAFLYNVSMEEYSQMVKEAKEKAAHFNSQSEFSISLAVGYVQIKDNKILEAAQEADKKMYAEKSRQCICRE